MATKTTKARRSEAAEKVAALHEEVAAGVAALVESDQWRAMLTMQARFHTYSFGNLLLILRQCPDATRVAGFRVWQDLGRQVRKGERGIAILAPCTYRPVAEDQEQGEATGGTAEKTAAVGEGRPARQVRGWRRVHVFDVAQTDGDPLPQVTPPLVEGQAPQGLWEALGAQVAAHGYRLERGDTGPADGWADPKTRTVRVAGHDVDAQAVAVLAHELGHIECGHLDEGEPTSRTCRGRFEVEAESVAYVIATAHGINSKEASFGYVAHWAKGDTTTVRAAAQTVTTAARRILAALDDHATDQAVDHPQPAAAPAS